MSAPHYEDGPVTIWQGDCIEVMRTLPSASVDAVVTDPPYGLEFMGKDWDRPWAVGMSKPGYSDGERLTRPSYRDNRNATCATCGGRMRGAKRCTCENPQWKATGAARGVGDQDVRQPGDEDYTAGPGPYGRTTVRYGLGGSYGGDTGHAMRAFQTWCEDWAREALRVLKPGGHLLAFGGTRTFHRLAAGIEDAGFEIRDSIAWHYGSGFPKSRNVSADPMFCQCPEGESERDNGDLHGVREDVSDASGMAQARQESDLLTTVQRGGTRQGMGAAREQRSGRVDGAQRSLLPLEDDRGTEPGLEGRRDVQAPQGELRAPADGSLPAGARADGAIERLRAVASARDGAVDRETVDPLGVRESHRSRHGEQFADQPRVVSDEPGSQARRGRPVCARCGKPTVEAGLGTALKPAFEPIVVARKPLIGTVAANVLAHGTGALNIDGCRIGNGEDSRARVGEASQDTRYTDKGGTNFAALPGVRGGSPDGRWPANVVLDETQAAALDQQSGQLTSGSWNGQRTQPKTDAVYGAFEVRNESPRVGDSGGASRFFYTAKASTGERPSVDGIAHPTVKPLDLMQWLVRLVTPKGGTVLEPFAGSGTTVEACLREGFRCIAIEREADYLPLIMQRVSKPHVVGLDFGDWEDVS